MLDGNIILSVAKAMELLQLLNQAAKPMPLTELVQKSGYPKSTVFGLLATMRAYDVVTQTADGKYALGLRLFEFGRQVERSWDISIGAPQEAECLLRRLSLAPFTPYTVTDVQELMQELDACRANGYAIENGEYKIGLRSISAPVYTVEGEVRYTVGVIGMFRSVHSDEFQVAVNCVQDTARMISTALGYQKQEEPI